MKELLLDIFDLAIQVQQEVVDWEKEVQDKFWKKAIHEKLEKAGYE